ncbi:MAG TPA: hypothetical protein VFB46_07335 [Gemmatimonadaceae bacterium]|nr:hypothetical protein [Gemmatimonadaceae bacterium]
MSDETRRRFLLAIGERVPPDRVEEVRLFRPIRQGGQETGAAVVAVEPEPPAEGADGGNGPSRHIVYSARYRLVLKGPDRGRWEASVTAEADAPLATVEAVVRGVLRRAGEDEDPERLTGEMFREALVEERWTSRSRTAD